MPGADQNIAAEAAPTGIHPSRRSGRAALRFSRDKPGHVLELQPLPQFPAGLWEGLQPRQLFLVLERPRISSGLRNVDAGADQNIAAEAAPTGIHPSRRSGRAALRFSRDKPGHVLELQPLPQFPAGLWEGL
ncbi:hypothetical protein JF55_17805 [Pseudomonas sp. 1-7]|nr:hypothetical protein JF55_17805 [Pseudomonas sp. 1-7]